MTPTYTINTYAHTYAYCFVRRYPTGDGTVPKEHFLRCCCVYPAGIKGYAPFGESNFKNTAARSGPYIAAHQLPQEFLSGVVLPRARVVAAGRNSHPSNTISARSQSRSTSAYHQFSFSAGYFVALTRSSFLQCVSGSSSYSLGGTSPGWRKRQKRPEHAAEGEKHFHFI